EVDFHSAVFEPDLIPAPAELPVSQGQGSSSDNSHQVGEALSGAPATAAPAGRTDIAPAPEASAPTFTPSPVSAASAPTADSVEAAARAAAAVKSPSGPDVIPAATPSGPVTAQTTQQVGIEPADPIIVATGATAYEWGAQP